MLTEQKTPLTPHNKLQGDLYNLLNSDKTLSWRERYRIAYEVSNGLHELHEKKILHPLESSKIFFGKNGRAKLTKNSELLEEPKRSQAYDIYSLGIVLVELASRKPLRKGATVEEVLEMISSDTPVEFKQIIEECLQSEEKRPSADTVAKRLESLWKAELRKPVTPSLFSSPLVTPRRSQTSSVSSSVRDLPPASPKPLTDWKLTEPFNSFAALRAYIIANLAQRANVRELQAMVKEEKKLEAKQSMQLSGHEGHIAALVVLPDGRVASGSFDNTIKLWDLTNGKVETLKGHTGTVNALTVLRGGRLVSASDDGIIKVWDTKSGKCEVTLAGHEGGIWGLAVLPNGLLVSCSFDKTIKVWSVKNQTVRAILVGHTRYVTAVAVLPDGRLVSASADKTIKVWNVKSGECEVTLEGHKGLITALIVLSDGRVASSSVDKTIKVWNVESGECEVTLEGHVSYVTSLAELPDRRLVSGSYDRTIKVWDVERNTAETLLEYTHIIRVLKVLPGGRLMNGSDDDTINIWRVTAPSLFLSVPFAFQDALRRGYSLTLLEDGFTLTLSYAAKDELTECMAALQQLCADLPFKHSVTEKQLQLNELSPKARDEIVKLTRAFLTTPALVSSSSTSLLEASRRTIPVSSSVASLIKGFQGK